MIIIYTLFNISKIRSILPEEAVRRKQIEEELKKHQEEEDILRRREEELLKEKAKLLQALQEDEDRMLSAVEYNFPTHPTSPRRSMSAYCESPNPLFLSLDDRPSTSLSTSPSPSSSLSASASLAIPQRERAPSEGSASDEARPMSRSLPASTKAEVSGRASPPVPHHTSSSTSSSPSQSPEPSTLGRRGSRVEFKKAEKEEKNRKKEEEKKRKKEEAKRKKDAKEEEKQLKLERRRSFMFAKKKDKEIVKGSSEVLRSRSGGARLDRMSVTVTVDEKRAHIDHRKSMGSLPHGIKARDDSSSPDQQRAKPMRQTSLREQPNRQHQVKELSFSEKREILKQHMAELEKITKERLDKERVRKEKIESEENRRKLVQSQSTPTTLRYTYMPSPPPLLYSFTIFNNSCKFL